MDDRASAPRLSVVLVSFNSAEVVRGALDPLRSVPDIEVIVVDNNSSDDTRQVLKRDYPEVIVVANGENVGFARAVNEGVRRASGDALMLLNPDAALDAAAIDVLLERSRADHAGLIAPFIGHDFQRIVSAGWLPTTWRMFTHYSGLSRFAGSRTWLQGHYLFPAQLETETPVEWVTGACFVCQRAVWDSVGGLSERWFMYAEDIEFSGRVHEAGYENVVMRNAVAHHAVGGSDSSRSLSGSSAWVINLRDYFARDLATSRASVAVWTAVVAGGLASRAAVFAALALRSRSNRGRRLAEARTFAGYAKSLLTSPTRSAR